MTWSNSALRHLSWPLWHQKKSSLVSDRWNLTKRCFFQSCCRPSRKAGTAKRKIGIGATATFRLRGRPSRRGPKVRIAAKAPNRPDRWSSRRSKSRLWKGDHWLFLVRGGCQVVDYGPRDPKFIVNGFFPHLLSFFISFSYFSHHASVLTPQTCPSSWCNSRDGRVETKKGCLDVLPGLNQAQICMEWYFEMFPSWAFLENYDD